MSDEPKFAGIAPNEALLYKWASQSMYALYLIKNWCRDGQNGFKEPSEVFENVHEIADKAMEFPVDER